MEFSVELVLTLDGGLFILQLRCTMQMTRVEFHVHAFYP